MNDISFPCGKFAGSLRKELISEHLGLHKTTEQIDVTDIIKQSFYKDVWRARSNQNTEIYEKVFHCIPTDKVVNFSILKQYQAEEPLCLSDPLQAQEMVDQIKVWKMIRILVNITFTIFIISFIFILGSFGKYAIEFFV